MPTHPPEPNQPIAADRPTAGPTAGEGGEVLQAALNAELHRQWWCRDDGPVFGDEPVAGDEPPLSAGAGGLATADEDQDPPRDLLSFRDLLRDAPSARPEGRRLRDVA